MKSDARLVFFTATFPYGIGEAWKCEDVRLLAQCFREVMIQPLEGLPSDQDDFSWMPSNVIVRKPLFERSGLKLTWMRVLQAISLSPWRVLRECWIAWRRGGRRAAIDVFVVAEKTRRVMRHHGFQELVRTGSRRVLFYFYWGIGSATAVSFLEPSVGRRALVRFHGFDLYAERGSGHVPFQKDLVRRLAMGTPCSEYGLDYLRELYPDAAATGRLRCMRLGTRSIGLSRGSDDGMLRIVSIAFMHPVKRVTLLAQAITKVTCPVRWEHIGDGPDWQAVNELVQSVPANVEVILHGKLSPKEAHAHLVKKSFDLFINTSESEGVPVSIMEALSAGIPVIATAVGGTPEIVDQQVGRLIPKDITPITLAKTIDDFAALPQHSRDDLRRNAYKRFAERCDQEVVGRQLIESLLQIEATFYDDSNADDMGRE